MNSLNEKVRQCHDNYQCYCTVSARLNELQAMLVNFQAQGVSIGRLRELVETAGGAAAELGAKALLAFERALVARDRFEEADCSEETDRPETAKPR